MKECMLANDTHVYYTYLKKEITTMPYTILFSFVGNRDPYIENSDNEYGPVLSLLGVETFSRVFLICTGSDYFERARTVENIAQEETDNKKFNFIDLDLESPIDYEEIYGKELIDRIVNFDFD